MAGVSVGDEGDNPVAINVTPLVGILFCLFAFFLISFRFSRFEGKFDFWLPKAKGCWRSPVHLSLLDEMRVVLAWDEARQRTTRTVGSRRVDGDEELGEILRGVHDECVRIDVSYLPATIDADGRMPWSEVVDVMNVCKKNGVDSIRLALGGMELRAAPGAEER